MAAMDGSFHPLRVIGAAVPAALALVVASALADAAEIASARKVVNKVYGATLNRTLRVGEALTENQSVSTGADSAADLKFPDDTTLFVGEQSNLELGPREIVLVQGLVRVTSPPGAKRDIALRTGNATVTARGATFDVWTSLGATDVAVFDGQVALKTRSGAAAVSAGEAFRASLGLKPEALPAPPPDMRFGLRKMLAALAVPDASPQQMKAMEQAKKEMEQALAALEATPSFKQAIQNKRPENLIYLDTTGGRIVIEVLPDLAPRHVARIRDLTRARFYDGHIFHAVAPGVAVETGDPTGTGMGGTGEPMTIELSQTSFTRGTVGMTRGRNETDDSRFFIALGPARYLDGKATAWGRVIFGIDVADKLRPGSPPPDPDRIVSMRFAAEPKPGTPDNAVRVPCRDSDRRLGSC